MILTCPACQTRYQVDAAKFPPQGRSVRCARCGEVWHAMPAAEEDAPPEPVAESAPAPAPKPAPKPAPSPAYVPPAPPEETFVRPEPRNSEPQAGDDLPEEPGESLAQRVSKVFRQRLLIPFGWAALAGVVLVVGFVATVYRQAVVEAWPQSASLYAKLGMKVASSGLKIGNTKTSREVHDGQLVLTVSGALTNVTERELPVPQIRIGLVDSNKRELYHWMVAPKVMMLKPGQTTNFVTQLSNPPEEAANYQIGLAKAGE